eukprot:TRINITY_DN12133_c0_g1_i1.p3 TRINITY_DN12133_c0_g1~~TRINITY_DN12133_c0_g1_i1.p3  ORF type:complete len:76 (-),score=7.52 TRINITY_DN12133_c0_g1_i1:193-420(-)
MPEIVITFCTDAKLNSETGFFEIKNATSCVSNTPITSECVDVRTDGGLLLLCFVGCGICAVGKTDTKHYSSHFCA